MASRIRTHAALGRQPRAITVHRVPIPLRPHLHAACAEPIRYVWQPGYRRDKADHYRIDPTEIPQQGGAAQKRSFLWLNYCLWRLALLVEAHRNAPILLRHALALAEWRRDATAARHALAIRNQGLIRMAVDRLRPDPLHRDDWISECQFVLASCIQRFDASNGVRFSTYATPAFLRHASKLRSSTFRREIRHEQLTDRIDESASTRDDPAEHAALLDLREAIADPALGITDREWMILGRRFGLNGHAETTVRGIKDDLGVSNQTVYNLQSSALGKLRLALGVS